MGKKFSFLLCICVILIAPSSLFGTAILVMSHQGSIWMASDSLQVLNSGTDRRYVCKLNNAGNFYWGAASQFYDDESTGFSIAKIVEEIKDTPGGLKEKLTAFGTSAQPAFYEELKFLIRNDRDFRDRVPRSQWISGAKLVFAGLENGQPRAAVATFSLWIEPNGLLMMDLSEVRQFFPNEDLWTELGIGDEALQYVGSHYSRPGADDAAISENAILAVEKAHPKEVGGKVSVLQLSKDGFHWIRSGQCAQK